VANCCDIAGDIATICCLPLQKYSQQRELQRQLRQFIVTGADFYALLLHLLRELVREERNNLRLLGQMDDDITVPCRWAGFTDQLRSFWWIACVSCWETHQHMGVGHSMQQHTASTASQHRMVAIVAECAAAARASNTCRCLEDKAREVNITDISSFYNSREFAGSGFEVDRAAGIIVYHN